MGGIAGRKETQHSYPVSVNVSLFKFAPLFLDSLLYASRRRVVVVLSFTSCYEIAP